MTLRAARRRDGMEEFMQSVLQRISTRTPGHVDPHGVGSVASAAIKGVIRGLTHGQALEAAQNAAARARELEQQALQQAPGSPRRNELLQSAQIALVLAEELRAFS